LEEALGAQAKVSKSTVSRICEAIKVEFDAFKARDLSEVELAYLFAALACSLVARSTTWVSRVAMLSSLSTTSAFEPSQCSARG